MAEGKDPINGYNEACNNTSLGYLKVEDESMSAIRFWTTVKGDLPHLYYIFWKPEPLGMQFNTVECYITGEFIFIEI